MTKGVLIYVLLATFASSYDRDRELYYEGEFASYTDCRSAAKAFFYAHTGNDLWPFEALDGLTKELPGGVDFRWSCEGHFKETRE